MQEYDLVLGKSPGGKFLRFGGSEHVALHARSGAGKTSSFTIPNCFAWRGSLVVLDAAGDPLTVSASGDAKRNVSFKGDISVRVVAVDKTGLLQIKGAKTVDADKNKQTLNLTGWVRPKPRFIRRPRTLAMNGVGCSQRPRWGRGRPGPCGPWKWSCAPAP